jgi:hypothetical protein
MPILRNLIDPQVVPFHKIAEHLSIAAQHNMMHPKRDEM